MRSLSLSVFVLLLAACTAEPAEAPAPRAEAPAETEPPPPEMTTFAEPVGDAVGGGLDLSDTKVVVDDEGMLVIDVAIPEARRSAPSESDHVQVYLDIDRDYEESGYDVRLILLGNAARVERWIGGKWRDRTPAAYEMSFDHGVHIRVPASDVGIAGTFDFFVATIDEATGKVSDLSPDGALWQRWTYTR